MVKTVSTRHEIGDELFVVLLDYTKNVWFVGKAKVFGIEVVYDTGALKKPVVKYIADVDDGRKPTTQKITEDYLHRTYDKAETQGNLECGPGNHDRSRDMRFSDDAAPNLDDGELQLGD